MAAPGGAQPGSPAGKLRPVAQAEVIRVAYGEPALTLLADRVRAAKGGDPLAPVTVVVPANYAAVATRRALSRRGGVAGTAFLTLHRLAERIAGPALAAAGRRPVSAALVQHACRAALAEAPGILAPVAAHPATELALATAYRELTGVTPEALDALAAQSARAADVVRLVGTARDRLRAGWHDEHDLMVTAASLIASGTPDAVGPVIVHLPQRLPPGSSGLLAALAERAPLTVIVGATGVGDADRPVEDALAAAGLPVPPAPVGVERPRAARVVSASDPDEEVRAAVRLVVGAARDGVPLGRMAVLFGAADPYARILREQLGAAGIAANGTPVRAIGDMVLGRTLRGLLALPDRRFRRSDVLAAVSSSMVRGEDGRPVPVRAWERVSRAAGVVEGDDWSERLEAFADERIRRAAAAEDEERPALASRFRREAAAAGSLASFVARLRADLAVGTGLATWSATAGWAAGLLDRYVGDDRERWPEHEREAADRVEAAVERLGGLDALDGPTPSAELFRRLLEGELDVALQRVGRLGDGVLVGPLSLAVGLSLDRVVVLGLAEGTFPDRRLDDALLPDRERAAAGGQLVLRSDHRRDDHRHLLAALAAGPATVCFPRGDLRRPGDRIASRWLLDDATALAASAERLSTAQVHDQQRAPWLDVVPSFTAGVRRLGFPATGQEHRLARLLRAGRPLSPDDLPVADPVLAAGVVLASARRGAAFTRFDGNLTGLDLGWLADGDRAHSATRLQAWAVCPHAYLIEHVLGVEIVEEPERRLRLDPLDTGSLVHAVLQRFVEDGGHGRDRLNTIAAEVCDDFAARGRTGRQLFWRRDRARILADLDRFLTEDADWRRSSGARTIAAERRFDTVLALPGGRPVRVRGVIDRVDRLPDGRLVVIDYKTGRSDTYRDLDENDPHQAGTRLQPAIYAAAARDQIGGGAVRFDYWFTTRTGRFARIGYELTDAVAATVGSVLATIVDGIRGGLFPGRPPEAPGWNRVDCWYCAPDGLGLAEARRAWERKREDPVLAAYVELCEPGGNVAAP